MKMAAELWEKEIIPNWETQWNHKKNRKLWKNGIPSKCRGRVWELAIGNDLKLTNDLFLILQSKKIPKEVDDQYVKNSKTKINREGTINLIKIDVSRTFPILQVKS